MPGGGDTKQFVAEVQDDLRGQLLTNARELLMNDYKDTVPDNAALEIILKKLAMEHFKTVYRYDFNDHANTIKPPASLGTNQPAHSICSIIPPLGTQIADYLKKGVFDGLQLPSWMAEVAESDLSNIAYNFVERDTQNQWKLREFTRSYDAQIEDKESYKCDSVMVYCNGSLLEDGSAVNICIVYFVGVYYTVTTESKKTRDLIQAEAYKSAAERAGVSAIPKIQKELKETLDVYTQKQFETEFGYKYADNPPTSLPAHDVTGGMLGRTSNVCYIPEGVHVGDAVRNYVDNRVFKGIALNMPSTGSTAFNDIVGVCQSLHTRTATNSWAMTRFDRTYAHPYHLPNPIRQSGIVMSWHDHKTTQQGVYMSVIYIYLMTIVYEEQNPWQELAQELFKQLCNNFRVHLKDPHADKTFDALAMKDCMFSYAKERWKQVFKFEYKGLQTVPLDKKSKRPVQAFDKLLLLNEAYTSEEDVEKWMNAELFKRDDTRFPAYIADLYDDLRDHIFRYSSKFRPKEANFWYEAEYSQEFIDPSADKRDVKHYGLFVYGIGVMALDKMDGSTEGVRMERLFVYYLGVVSSFVPLEW